MLLANYLLSHFHKKHNFFLNLPSWHFLCSYLWNSSVLIVLFYVCLCIFHLNLMLQYKPAQTHLPLFPSVMSHCFVTLFIPAVSWPFMETFSCNCTDPSTEPSLSLFFFSLSAEENIRYLTERIRWTALWKSSRSRMLNSI